VQEFFPRDLLRRALRARSKISPQYLVKVGKVTI